MVSVVLVSWRYLTHPHCFPFKATNKFWVGKSTVARALCMDYPYFTSLANHKTRLYLGIFQQEPAIARLDRLFTPNHKSFKCMYTTLVQASILLSEDFTLLMIRSSGFRSYPCDYRPFRLACAPASNINLATWTNSLARFSKRTLQSHVPFQGVNSNNL